MAIQPVCNWTYNEQNEYRSKAKAAAASQPKQATFHRMIIDLSLYTGALYIYIFFIVNGSIALTFGTNLWNTACCVCCRKVLGYVVYFLDDHMVICDDNNMIMLTKIYIAIFQGLVTDF